MGKQGGCVCRLRHNGGTGRKRESVLFHVILYEPEIPPNTGNVIRLCANTGCSLHLVEPLGFKLEDARLRRAGLDYREFASVRTWPGLDACLDNLAGSRVYAFETDCPLRYTQAGFSPGDALLFGPETRRLPQAVIDTLPAARRLRLPMLPGNRSLNLSNAVAVTVFEAWRQQGFVGSV